MISSIRYYLWSSRRRKELDRLQHQHRNIYRGTVLDIGGRDRGKFEKPKHKVKKWIFADIVPEHKPDMILDVADMHQIPSKSIDVINAIELFEHVFEIEKGIDECERVLRKKGYFICSTPFMYPVHADPHDYQRWTEYRWKKELEKRSFKIKKKYVMGKFFSIIADANKSFVNSMPFGIRHICMISFPIFDVISQLDKAIPKKSKLHNFHGGYFFIAEKVK